MAGLLLKVSLAVVALLAIGYQLFLKDLVMMGLGIGREMQPLSDFPYSCRKIEDDRMQSCEDMWFSEATRQLFLVCSDPIARSQWMPNNGAFNLTGRSTKDALVALDVDKPLGNGFELKVLSTPDFPGTAGDGLLSLAGFTGFDNVEQKRVELLVVNNQPSVDPSTGEPLDQTAANTTIELFHLNAKAAALTHVRTYADKNIATPNRVAALSGDEFYITNDHGLHKTGIQHHLSVVTGTGNVVYCKHESGCSIAASGLQHPNGLGRHEDLLYVPSSMTGFVTVYRIHANRTLEKVDDVPTGYALDNVSADSKGDLFVAAFPVGVEIFKVFKDPFNARAPTAALRIAKKDGHYTVEKTIEDDSGEVLPAATTVIRDAKTGRLFFSSVISPYIAVCDPR